MYATREHSSERGFAHHVSAMENSTPPNFSSALTTPMRAPPAIKPLAMSVPFSPRALFTLWSLLRVVTYQLTAPPTTNGTFSSRGINIPSANARAGILSHVSTMARAAPMAYSTHGAPTPFISGSMTAAMALACGAAKAPEAKP